MTTLQSPSGYALDSAWHAERERLTSLTSMYDPDTLRLADGLGLRAGWRCLDVGAGTGSVVELFADRVGPTGSVLAVDLDTRFLDAIDRANVEVARSDITSEPLPDGSFDLVHARLLLEHLPQRDAVLSRLIAAVRPGGWLLVEDFDWATADMVEPCSPLHLRVVAAVRGLLADRGYDPDYGRRLPRLLREHGLTDVATDTRSVQVHADPEVGVPAWELLVDQLAPALLAQGLLTESDIAAFHTLWHDGVHDCFAPLMVSCSGRRSR
jgi:SAM-dependent methyltransferase